MKLYLLIMGLICFYLAVVAGPAFYFGADTPEIISFFESNLVSSLIAGGVFLLGFLFVFISGFLFAKKSEDSEYLEECPGCGEEISEENLRRGKCPECGSSLLPPRFSLDTAAFTGALIALVLLGVLAGSVFVGLSEKLTALIMISVFGGSLTSFLMGLCSLIAERRRVFIAFLGMIFSGAVLGMSVYIFI